MRNVRILVSVSGICILGLMSLTTTGLANTYPELEAYVHPISDVVKEMSDSQPRGDRGNQLRGMVGRQRQPGTSVIFDDPKQWVIVESGDITVLSRLDHSLLLSENDYCNLTFKSQDNSANVLLLSKEAVPIDVEFNAIDLWVGGDDFDWAQNHKSPLQVIAILEDSTGEIHEINMGSVRWHFWGLLTRRLGTEMGIGHEARGGDRNWVLDYPVKFRGLRIPSVPSGGYRQLTLDSIVFYNDEMSIPDICYVASSLEFPTTEDTILPSVKDRCEITVEEVARKQRVFFTEKGVAFRSSDGVDEVIYTYFPKTGTLSDIQVNVRGNTFRPCDRGEVIFLFDGCRYRTSEVKTELKSLSVEDDVVLTQWIASKGEESTTYTIRLTAKGKSLVVDFQSDDSKIVELGLGVVSGLTGAKALIIPYLTMGFDKNVGIAYNNDVFISVFLDWYTTHASEFYGGLENGVNVRINGGSTYRVLTDGSRNSLKERMFLTVSSDFEEVLPSIPNPPAKTLEVTRRYMHSHWCSAETRRFDMYMHLVEKYKFLGIDYAAITIHEDLWSSASKYMQGPEEFTMTFQAAPDIPGGEESIRDWVERSKALGYYVGPYNNYTDCSPVGEAWKREYMTRDSNGELHSAWAPCYSLKPIKAVDMQEYYSTQQVERYGFNTDYNDVHTCVPPWYYVDYQTGIPGAGMLSTTFYSYGRLLQRDQEVFGGPVISEGGHHWMYAGLVSGSYAQMRIPGGKGIESLPMLVNFDLLKMHPLQADVGVNYDERLDGDRYKGLAWTIGYGHAGYLPFDQNSTWPSQYYHLLEALQARYVGVLVDVIRYGTTDGRMVDVNNAIVNGHLENNFVYVKYTNGLEIYVNGNPSKQWTVTLDGDSYVLSSNNWVAKLGDELLTYSLDVSGRRESFVKSPEYIYVDGGGQETDFGPAVTASSLAIKTDSSNRIRVIVLNKQDTSVLLKGVIEETADVKIYSIQQELLSATELEVSNGEAVLEFVDRGVVYDIEW